MRYILFIVWFVSLTIPILSSCHGQLKDDGKTYNKEYIVGTIPTIDNFSKLSENEVEIDSIFGDYEKHTDSLVSSNPKYKETGLAQKRDFSNNRSRVFMENYNNGNQQTGDSAISMPCSCFVDKDTIFISMIIGFFGGVGFDIKLFGNNFESNFFIYTDDVKPYKPDLLDTVFYSQLSVKNKFQSLVVDKKPTFKTAQQITGYLTFTSKNFYEKAIYNSLDTAYVKGRLYFICNTSKANKERKWGLK
jgi:hypothetical protein